MTAHTKTDKLETFFQQLFRGASLEGITSLNTINQVNKNIFILRPLINISRIETHWFCRKFSLPIWSDISNYNYSINRNRIRYELMPYLKQYFNKNIFNNIFYFLSTAGIDNEYIKQCSLKLYLLSRHNLYIALNYELIQQQHYSIQCRVLYIFFYHNLNKLIEKNSINYIINYFNYNKNNKTKIIYRSISINLDHNWIYISLTKH